ncbi:MAG TPA: glycosyltransferase family 2 protein [Gemmatimonadaceae bacterium]|nr:glycosyltransferase family 2 protein [Gemmatimonadaceae bacterium]
MRALFWVSAFLALYPYLIFPALLVVMRHVIARPPRKAPIEPTVAMLVAAYNEEHVIAAKIENSLAIDYPADRLETVIVSDGSSDSTNAIAARYDDGKRIRLLAFPVNRGKLAAMNDAIRQFTSEIVVFSDAASMIAPESLRMLVRNFADPSVGAVSGVYMVRNPGQSALGKQEDFYWRFETSLKAAEADVHSTLGAHGSLYAIRRELYPFPEPGIINDDFVIPMRIVARGYRAVYEPGAVAAEEAHEMEGFQRRVRIGRGNIQQLGELRRLLMPPRPMPLFFFLSHKVARLLVPPAMIICLVANLFLLGSPLYRPLLAGQVIFYVLAIAGAVVPLRPRFLRLPYYFTMVNAGLVVALFQGAVRRRPVAWGDNATQSRVG